jgi:hypothetical protein
VIKAIFYIENCNMNKWLKTGSLKRPHESNMNVSSKSTDCLPPEASTSNCSQSIKETTSTTSTKKLSTYVRKCNPSYSSFGFTYTGEESAPVPQCVICYETLSNHSMKPSLLMLHFETKHRDLKHKPLGYFQRKLSDLSASKGQIM